MGKTRRSVLQKRILILSIVLMLGCSWLFTLLGCEPTLSLMDQKKYQERVVLLKYFISLGFAVIGATWFLSKRDSENQVIRSSFSTLSWAWTCLSIALLSATVEIYLTYKDFYSWQGATKTPDCIVQTGRHMLGITYFTTDVLFFVGAVLILLALTDVLGGGKDSERH